MVESGPGCASVDQKSFLCCLGCGSGTLLCSGCGIGSIEGGAGEYCVIDIGGAAEVGDVLLCCVLIGVDIELDIYKLGGGGLIVSGGKPLRS